MDKIAVLIPCYNEEKTIAKVVADAKAALPEAVIYVYDNNSTDRTVELAREAGAVIRHEYMQGKGNVIRGVELYCRDGHQVFVLSAEFAQWAQNMVCPEPGLWQIAAFRPKILFFGIFLFTLRNVI